MTTEPLGASALTDNTIFFSQCRNNNKRIGFLFFFFYSCIDKYTYYQYVPININCVLSIYTYTEDTLISYCTELKHRFIFYQTLYRV